MRSSIEWTAFKLDDGFMTTNTITYQTEYGEITVINYER